MYMYIEDVHGISLNVMFVVLLWKPQDGNAAIGQFHKNVNQEGKISKRS